MVEWPGRCLVHAVAGHTIQFQLVHLEHGKCPVGSQVDGFAQTLIIGCAFSNIEGGCRNLGVQAFQDRVAAHHKFGLFTLVTALVTALALQLALMCRVIDTVFCLGGWALAAEATSDFSAAALLGAFLFVLRTPP